MTGPVIEIYLVEEDFSSDKTLFPSWRRGCHVQRLPPSLPPVMSQAGGELQNITDQFVKHNIAVAMSCLKQEGGRNS